MQSTKPWWRDKSGFLLHVPSTSVVRHHATMERWESCFLLRLVNLMEGNIPSPPPLSRYMRPHETIIACRCAYLHYCRGRSCHRMTRRLTSHEGVKSRCERVEKEMQRQMASHDTVQEVKISQKQLTKRDRNSLAIANDDSSWLIIPISFPFCGLSCCSDARPIPSSPPSDWCNGGTTTPKEEEEEGGTCPRLSMLSTILSNADVNRPWRWQLFVYAWEYAMSDPERWGVKVMEWGWWRGRGANRIGEDDHGMGWEEVVVCLLFKSGWDVLFGRC